jgi:hypothetical protein
MASVEDSMQRNKITITVFASTVLVALSCAICLRVQAEKPADPAMAPLDQYLSPDEQAEVVLARSAAPASISDHAEVMVLRRDGYATAVEGSNGFVCIVERSWTKSTDAPDFWNPKFRAPNCFNASAARFFLPILLMKTKLVLSGRSKAEIAAATASALDDKVLPALEPGAMCYMMSKQQYFSDEGKNWHPHIMFYAVGDAAKSWGANLPGSPVIAVNDPEKHVTTFMVLAANWSDGTPGPSMGQ